ncbi:MAG: DUF1062 domain-containing protein [Rhizobiales bacterium]|nr:DUF1062 domain-containing protein [Hyphomicrobiales bacterium]
MRELLRVTWTVTPLRPPEPWRHCSHCNAARKFRSTDKFRANSQKKRIDIWLIYGCEVCEESWNLPVLERATVSAIEPAALEGFIRNDSALVRRHAFDVARLRRHTGRIESCCELAVAKAHVSGGTSLCDSIAITIRLTEPGELRLDAFLARELGLSRSAVARLSSARLLRIQPGTCKAMRGNLADGQTVTLNLEGVDAEMRKTLMRSALEPGSRASP